MKSLHLSSPHMLVVVGLPGSGKTMFVDKFSETFGAPRLSADTITANARDAGARTMLAEHFLTELLKTKQTVVIDGLGMSRVERTDLARMARGAGYTLLTIWVQTDAATAKSRATKPNRQQKQLGLTSEEFERKAKQFTPPHSIEKAMVISGKHTPATQVKTVLKRLTEPRATISSHSTPPVREADASRRSITVR